MSIPKLNVDFYKHNDDVIFRKDDENTLAILNIAENSIFEISDIAAEVFLALDGSQSLSQVKTQIEEKFGPPKDLFKKDFEKLILDLKRNNLITKI